ncbi:hypothetical protein DUI87_05784 [Hirundo rustica rustica]|uniref:Uncharacterized protein n=1 Tax=Hirundo rustica rustica TaxID=333673 RepID=A0A3M0LDJ7_HIRRU|nr:hypothetical protein DUI87_05784 [Hirundo rustica rustica]
MESRPWRRRKSRLSQAGLKGIPKLLMFSWRSSSDNRIIDALYYLIQQVEVLGLASGLQQLLAVLQSGAEWLESSPGEKDLEVDNHLSMSQDCAQAAKKASCILAWNSVAIRTREVNFPLHSVILEVFSSFNDSDSIFYVAISLCLG